MSDVLSYIWGSLLAGAGLVSCGYLFTLGALLAMRQFGIRAGFAYKLTDKPRSKSQRAADELDAHEPPTEAEEHNQ